jgi:hypothetical protein
MAWSVLSGTWEAASGSTGKSARWYASMVERGLSEYAFDAK